MQLSGSLIVMLLSAVGCVKANHTDEAHSGPAAVKDEQTTKLVGKKGVGASSLSAEQLAELNLSWYYNWGLDTKVDSPIAFVPMLWGPSKIDRLSEGEFTHLLGFNEPDHPKQANITVAEALKHWPQLVAAAKTLGAPAMAGDALKENSWLRQFMKAGPKVDFVTVHWYRGIDAKEFERDITAIYETFRRPIWITEFACQTHGDSTKSPDKYTQDEVNQFIAAVTAWMEKQSFIERYAWHDSKLGTSSLFAADGKLSATGKAYARVR